MLPIPIRKAYTKALPEAWRCKLESWISGPYPRIYDQKRFVFIHIPKTAGKSVCKMIGVRGARHLRYVDYERHLQLKIDDYYLFTVVRDPMDRLRSAYSYMKSGGNQSAKDLQFHRDWIAPFTNLQEFVREALQAPPVAESGKFRPQTDFLIDQHQQYVERIVKLRFENLAAEVKHLPQQLLNHSQLPHLNASDKHRETLTVDPETQSRIYDFYREDYRYLRYAHPGEQP